MLMKRHILAALREELAAWEQLIASVSESKLTAPNPQSGWSIKDELAHLWGWQQRTLARVEAALADREPAYPAWPAGLDPETEESLNQINAWLYESSRELGWPVVYERWRANFGRVLELSEAIGERDLLDSSRYAWLDGHSLVDFLIGTYDHHQEHLDALLARLDRR